MTILKRRNGTILIDAMVGIYLLVIVALILSATLATAAVSRAMAEERTKAASIVSRHLESIRNVGYGSMSYDGLRFYGLIQSSPTTSPYSFTQVGSSNDRVSSILPGGAGAVTITDVSSTLRKVTVTVTWNGRTGTRSVSSSTELAKLK